MPVLVETREGAVDLAVEANIAIGMVFEDPSVVRYWTVLGRRLSGGFNLIPLRGTVQVMANAWPAPNLMQDIEKGRCRFIGLDARHADRALIQRFCCGDKEVMAGLADLVEEGCTRVVGHTPSDGHQDLATDITWGRWGKR